MTINLNAVLTGGLSGDAVTRANAITLTGGTNQLTLGAGAVMTGGIGVTGSLEFAQPTDLTVPNVISGPGSISKTGASTLTLTGTNTYFGVTTISEGALQIGNGGTTGSITGDVVNNGQLTFNRSDNLTFGGAISGAGPVTKLGAAFLTLTGNNTYTGVTTITAGVLQVGNGGTTGTLPGDVINNGELRFNRSGSVTNGGTISGPGGVIVIGALVTLSGNNTYAGGTSVITGALAISSSANLGTGSLFLSGGTLRTLAGLTLSRQVSLGSSGGQVGTNGFDSTVFGNISGTGAFTKTGAGVLTLFGDNTYTGVTTISAGTLQVGEGGDTGNLPGDVVNDGALIFNRSDDVTFGGAISGAGSLSQDGGGVLVLTSANTFVGGTAINGGTIAVGHANALGTGDVMVGDAGALRVDGAIKTIQIGGNYTQLGTLTLRVGGPSAGQYDALNIGGTATLGGTLNLVSANGFQPRAGDRFTFLSAAQGVTGTFATVNQPDFALKLTVSYLPNEVVGITPPVGPGDGNGGSGSGGGVIIEVEQIPFTEFAETSNQSAVARNLNKVVFDPRADELIGYLDSLPTSELPKAFELIAPADVTAIFQTMVSLANVQGDNLERRLRDAREGSRGFSTIGLSLSGRPEIASEPARLPPVAAGEESDLIARTRRDDRWGAFMTGHGEFTRVGDDFNARGYDLQTGGFTLGADYRVSDHLILGLSAGYAHTDAEISHGGSIELDGAKVGLYGIAYWEKLYVDLAASVGWNTAETRRAALLDHARGDTESTEVYARLNAGYECRVGGFRFGPLASVRYNHIGLNSFTEHGSLAPLSYPDQDEEAFRTNLGLMIAYEWKVRGVRILPRLKAVGSSRVDLQACKLEYSIVSPK